MALSFLLAAGGFSVAAQDGPPPLSPPVDGSAPPFPPPEGAGPPFPANPGPGISGEARLLAPLPPPSEEILAQYPPSTDPRDLEGVWLADPQVFMARMRAGPQDIPYTEAAQARLARKAEQEREADAQGLALLSDAGRCRPMGAISVGADLFPAEIIQTNEKVVILTEEGRGRWVIHLDEKAANPNRGATYFGHSVGRWEGDELVVETVGLRPAEGFFSVGMRSEDARIVSRLRKSEDGRRLTLRSTIHDPQTYTRPFEAPEAVSTWHPELQVLEFQCEENPIGAREGMIEIEE